MRTSQVFNLRLGGQVRAANKAGNSVDEATAAINLNAKFPGYKNDRYKATIQAIYDELKVAARN